MQRGDRLLKKAQDLRRESIDTTQAVYPESDLNI